MDSVCTYRRTVNARSLADSAMSTTRVSCKAGSEHVGSERAGYRSVFSELFAKNTVHAATRQPGQRHRAGALGLAASGQSEVVSGPRHPLFLPQQRHQHGDALCGHR